MTIKRILIILGGVYCLKSGWEWFQNSQKLRKHKKLEEAAEQFLNNQKERVQSFKIPQSLESPEKIHLILNASVSELQTMLISGEVKSEDLVNIFSHRCQTLGLDLFAVTDLDYEYAIKQAQACDKIIQELGSAAFKDQPLLGIPVSVKEIFEMKGFACTFGCFARKDLICKEDGLIIKMLRQAGAIPFVRSNVPQLGMSIETMNRLYGRCLNPWDRTRYPGGSSGGEGALLASRASPLGLGTDFGGSVRTPACINGICAFKPTNGRVPQKGIGLSANTTLGQLAIKTTLGPMGKHTDDLALMMKALLNDSYANSQLPSVRGAHTQIVPFSEDAFNSKDKVKIGYYSSLPYFQACEAQQRAVLETVEILRKLGHEVIEIEFPFAEALYRIYYELLSSDNNAKYADLLGEEDYLKEYAMIKYLMTQASALTRVSLRLFLRLISEHRSADLLDWGKVNRSAEDFMKINGKLLKLREKVVQYFDELEIQAILSPGLGVPAFEHGTSPNYLICTIYPLIWNVLNFPAGVVPITTIRHNEQKYETSIVCDTITKKIQKAMKNTKGLPMGVQISSLPFQDELCLNLMKQIEGEVQFYKKVALPH